jgi:hypothetical protein
VRLVPLILVLALGLNAQQPREDNAELLSTIERFRSAIAAEDWKHAAELSKSLSNSVSGSRDSVLSRSASSEIENFIEALPENTETVAVAQGSFKLSAPGGNVQLDALQVARGYVLGLLSAAEKGQVFKALEGRTMRYAVLVARKFRNHPPDGSQGLPLGMIDYQGCAVYAVAGTVSETVFPKVPETTIFGKRVWLMQGKQYEQARDATPKIDTYLFTLLKADTILACNDRDFFESIVQGIAAPAGKHGLPPNLPEWRHVERSAPFWALRHFRTDAAGTDPTDPRRGSLFGIAYDGSIGVTLQVESPAGQIQAHWLSTPSRNPWEAFTKSPDVGSGATTRKVADGTWELSVRDDLAPGYFTVFALMGMLGFAVLL